MATFQGRLHTGHQYHIHVRASNPADLSHTETATFDYVADAPTSGIVMEITLPPASPPAPFMLDFADDDIDFQTNNNSVSTRWHSFVHTSHPVLYEVAMGTYPGGSDVIGFTSVSSRQRHTFSFPALTGSSLPDGIYYTTVRASNVVGNVTVSSDGIRIFADADSLAAQGRVLDGAMVSTDIDVQLSTSQLAASWSFPLQLHDFISHYEWRVQTRTQSVYSDVVNPSGVGNVTMATTAVELTLGQTYFVSVRPCHAHTCFAWVQSDGVLVSRSPAPRTSSATYSPPTAGQSQPSISIQWDSFASAGAHVDYYQWALGTSKRAGSELLLSWQRVDANTLQVMAVALCMSSFSISVKDCMICATCVAPLHVFTHPDKEGKTVVLLRNVSASLGRIF